MLRWLAHSQAMPLKLPNCAPNFPQTNEDTSLVDSPGFTSSRAILPWLGVNANENTINNLSLTLESIAPSTVQAIVALTEHS